MNDYSKSTSPADINDVLAFNISRVGLLLRRELIRALAEYSVTPEQWEVLMALWTRDTALSQRDIGEIVLKDKHALSRMVARLEENGWVKKRIPKGDRRMTEVYLTRKGKNACAKMRDKLSCHIKTKVFNHFTSAEKSVLKETMKTMRRLMGDDIPPQKSE